MTPSRARRDGDGGARATSNDTHRLSTSWCPEPEASERRGRAHALERIRDDSSGETDGAGERLMMIRRYCRDVRTYGYETGGRASGGLERSMVIVVRTLEACEECSAWVIRGVGSAAWNARTSRREQVAFANDRLRALRQDLTRWCAWMREAGDVERIGRVAGILETMVTHAAKHRRAEDDDNVDDVDADYDVDDGNIELHDEQLGKTFGMLFATYADLGAHVDAKRVGKYYAMWMCWRASETRDILSELRRLASSRPDVIATEDVRAAIACHRAYVDNNYVRFFNYIESDACSYERALCSEKHFTTARVAALRVMNVSHNQTPVSFKELARMLRMDNDADVESLALACGLSVDERGVSFRTHAFKYPSLREMRALRPRTERVLDSKRIDAFNTRVRDETHDNIGIGDDEKDKQVDHPRVEGTTHHVVGALADVTLE